MAVLYIKEQGAVIRKRGARLLVEKDKEALLEIPLRKTDAVAVFGSVQVTTQALSVLLEEGIPLSLFTRHGRLKGHLTPEASRNAPLRVEQYRRALDEEKALEMARRIVEAKIANARATLDDYRGNYPSAELGAWSGRLGELAVASRETKGHAELLGVEGAAAALWFEAFGRLNRSQLAFEGRRRRPSPDPMNALLSLGYSLLTAELRAMAEAAGFEPHVGFLHRVDYGRPSLALDLVEPFRPAVIDRLTLTLVNERVFEAEDFARSLAGPRAGQVVLLPGAFERYIERYEGALTKGREAAPKGIRETLAAEVDKLRRAMVDGAPFAPWREIA